MVYCPDSTGSTTGITCGAAGAAAFAPAGPVTAEETGSNAVEGASNHDDTTGSIGGRVATASADRTVRYWDAATGNCVVLQVGCSAAAVLQVHGMPRHASACHRCTSVL
jgi:hypothetical protein